MSVWILPSSSCSPPNRTSGLQHPPPGASGQRQTAQGAPEATTAACSLPNACAAMQPSSCLPVGKTLSPPDVAQRHQAHGLAVEVAAVAVHDVSLHTAGEAKRHTRRHMTWHGINEKPEEQHQGGGGAEEAGCSWAWHRPLRCRRMCVSRQNAVAHAWTNERRPGLCFPPLAPHWLAGADSPPSHAGMAAPHLSSGSASSKVGLLPMFITIL